MLAFRFSSPVFTFHAPIIRIYQHIALKNHKKKHQLPPHPITKTLINIMQKYEKINHYQQQHKILGENRL